MSVPSVAATWIATLLRKEPSEQQYIKAYLINRAYSKPLQFLSREFVFGLFWTLQGCCFGVRSEFYKFVVIFVIYCQRVVKCIVTS